MIHCGAVIRKLGAPAHTMQEVAKGICDFLHEALAGPNGRNAAPLVCFYRTARMSDLPPDLQKSAQKAAGERTFAPDVNCLILMASAGLESIDPSLTLEGRSVVPLPDETTLRQLPLAVEMTRQFGITENTLVGKNPTLMNHLSRSLEIFHVPEAVESPAVECKDHFVSAHGVESLLGFGGILPCGDLFAVVVFSTVRISAAVAEMFKSIALSAKVALTPFVDGPVFGTAQTAAGHLLSLTDKERESERLRWEVRVQEELLEVREEAVEVQSRKLETSLERLEFLEEANAVLTESLDYSSTLRRLARLAVPRLADWCAVDIIEDGGTVERLAVAHQDEHKVQLALTLQEKYPPDADAPRGVSNVIKTGRSEIYPEITEELLRDAARSPEHFELLRRLGFRSAMIVPLTSRGRTIGALTFVSDSADRLFGPPELALAEDVARRASSAIENSRLYRDRAHVAETLQASLLPPKLPVIHGLEIGSAYQAAGEGIEVGGDFYDIFSNGSGEWVAVIGDVCGKGPSAAAITGMARHTLRALSGHAKRPSTVLRRLNKAIIDQALEESYCTVAYSRMRLDHGKLKVTVANGGHLSPLILRRTGVVEEVENCGTLLGQFDDPDLSDVTFVVEKGESMVLVTDGLIEARRARGELGTETVQAVLENCAGMTARQTAARLHQTAVDFQGGRLRDDIAVVVIKVRDDL